MKLTVNVARNTFSSSNFRTFFFKKIRRPLLGDLFIRTPNLRDRLIELVDRKI